MTTDKRTNDPTPEQIEAAARTLDPDAFELSPAEWEREYGRAPEWSGQSQRLKREAAKHHARAALVAAAGAAPQETAARVVTRGFDTDCAAGLCPGACTHLMWECKSCSCEGGWGAPRDLLEQWAAEHTCSAQVDEAKLAELVERAERLTQLSAAAGSPIAEFGVSKDIAFVRGVRWTLERLRGGGQ